MRFCRRTGYGGIIGLICVWLLCGSFQTRQARWGFYAHRLINRMAVFTLPAEMLPLYKPQLTFLTGHAVDPDKRRYASRYEAVRHYIDLDVWGEPPFDTLPRRWAEAMLKFTTIEWVRSDTITASWSGLDLWRQAYLSDSVKIGFNEEAWSFGARPFRDFFQRLIMPGYYDEDWWVPSDSIQHYLPGFPRSWDSGWRISESLSAHGILPYHLYTMQRKLTRELNDGDLVAAIRTSAEMGHYLSDAHVPLHTTENYNGQLTGQTGIHAFWESRIPELFAEAEYDFWVGQAEYIDDPLDFFWNVVLQSHHHVDAVLDVERSLRQTFAEDRQYCFDERLNVTVRLPCEAFARAYQDKMEGMVEDRMRASILAVGSTWYTAWVDAGQPQLGMLESEGKMAMEKQLPTVIDSSLIRKHE